MKVNVLFACMFLMAGALIAGNPGTGRQPIPKDKLIDHADDANYKPIQGHYIVVLDDSKDADLDALLTRLRITPRYVYRDALTGFAGKLDAAQLEALRAFDEVLFVEQDGEVSTTEVQQVGPVWGLDRVDQRFLPLSGDYWRYLSPGASPFTTGTSTHLYVIDTGINYTHQEFTGRVSAAPGQFFDAFGGNGADCHGHGTHVAGTAGGSSFGVAKDTTLHSVRVLGCGGFGTWAGVIAGVNWVAANGVRPAVANMSLGGGFNNAANLAVDNAVLNFGVFFAVAAGNNGNNACFFSPASAAQAYTVGATTITDSRSGFSNFGPCVNLFAPGSNIPSAWIGGTAATNTISGTSMASPHVAGAAANYLSIYPFAPPGHVAAILSLTATPGVIANVGAGSPNLFLHSKANSLMSGYAGAVAGFTSSFEPLGVPYYTPTEGAHEGQLVSSGGPLTLRLREFQPATGTWNVVQTATGTSPRILFHGTEGSFQWEVFNPAAPGTAAIGFTFLMSQP